MKRETQRENNNYNNDIKRKYRKKKKEKINEINTRISLGRKRLEEERGSNKQDSQIEGIEKQIRIKLIKY